MGLPPTEHISLSFFTGHAEARYPARLYPCLRFAVHLAVHNAKLGAEWFATPFSWDSCIPCFMPVYPGALTWRLGAN